METKKHVGKVTAEERDQIQALFERKNGLVELVKILPADNHDLYEQLVSDMGHTQTLFQRWWDDMSAKYQWESSKNGQWEIDFTTCDIYLKK
ncbi:MAG: CXXX repeat peptide modification system protein [Prevotella sp.]|jgi:CXXX repeat modification system protein|nr:CXXX repeat peptide modification system protein [Prevotella sp.]